MLSKLTIFNIIGTCILVYLYYVQNIYKQNYVTYITILFIVLAVVNGYLYYSQPTESPKEKFSPKEVLMDTGPHYNYRQNYYVQINDEMIWENLSPYEQIITGDLIGTITLRPGEKYVHQYNQPGKFKFIVDNKCDAVRYVNVIPPKNGLLSNQGY